MIFGVVKLSSKRSKNALQLLVKHQEPEISLLADQRKLLKRKLKNKNALTKA
jgi:hypothetical protein